MLAGQKQNPFLSPPSCQSQVQLAKVRFIQCQSPCENILNRTDFIDESFDSGVDKGCHAGLCKNLDYDAPDDAGAEFLTPAPHESLST